MGMLDKVRAAMAKAQTARARWPLVVLIGAVFVVGALRLLGQNSAVPALGPAPLEQTNGQVRIPEFEVASVRLNEKWKFSDPGYSLDSDDNYVPGESLFTADGPLSTFIGFTYKLDLLHSMIANLPKCADGQTYEIRARVPGAPSKDQVRLMMRALLIERFQLAIHFEKQEKPALALTLVKSGADGAEQTASAIETFDDALKGPTRSKADTEGWPCWISHCGSGECTQRELNAHSLLHR
jgi:uncharacterized protein (TIGR03435 family)